MIDDDLGALIDLLHLPAVGPSRLRWLTTERKPSEVLGALQAGHLPAELDEPPRGVTADLVQRWVDESRKEIPNERLKRHRASGVGMLWPGHRLWPFADDPDPPCLVFFLGDAQLAISRPLVAIVGTRRCTTVGRRVARQIAAELAAPRSDGRSIGIVSGLAAGIDAEAHVGAVDAGGPVIGVVACGLDVPYPKSNEQLWNTVAERGLLLTESPLGASPERWKFPARNRLIAGLADLVVVVESHHSGGALSTVDEAALRGVTVGSVPGSVLSSASEGSNSLLVEGCPPVRSAKDVVGILGLPEESPDGVDKIGQSSTIPADRVDRPLVVGKHLNDIERGVFEATLGGPIHLDQLLRGLKGTRPEILAAIQRLVAVDLLAMEGARVTLAVEGSSQLRLGHP